MKKIFLLMTTFAIMANEPALAYTGPGLGAATIAIVVGFFTSIFVALFAVIWYPVKRLLKNRKKSQIDSAAASSNDDAASLKDGVAAGDTKAKGKRFGSGHWH